MAGGFVAAAYPAGETNARDHCYWLKVSGPYCNLAGQLVEQWCLRCCAGLSCETLRCELRVVGSC